MNYEVCVNSYARYHQGDVVGVWVELGREWHEVAEDLVEVGFDLDGFDEELFVIDDNGLGCGEANPYVVNRYLEQIDEDDALLFLACLEVLCFEEICEMLNNGRFEDIIFYEQMTLDDLACEIAYDLLDGDNCPDMLARYFDYERFALDLRYDGYVQCKTGVILIP